MDLSVDKLIFDGRRVTTAAASTLCHFAVHKPVGYICSNVSKQPGMRAVDLLQPWLDKWQQKHKVRVISHSNHDLLSACIFAAAVAAWVQGWTARLDCMMIEPLHHNAAAGHAVQVAGTCGLCASSGCSD